MRWVSSWLWLRGSPFLYVMSVTLIFQDSGNRLSYQQEFNAATCCESRISRHGTPSWQENSTSCISSDLIMSVRLKGFLLDKLSNSPSPTQICTESFNVESIIKPPSQLALWDKLCCLLFLCCQAIRHYPIYHTTIVCLPTWKYIH